MIPPPIPAPTGLIVARTPEPAQAAQIRPMLMRSPVPAWRRRVPPGFIPPCQPILADRVPSGDGWLHELKHDGSGSTARDAATIGEGQKPELRSLTLVWRLLAIIAKRRTEEA